MFKLINGFTWQTKVFLIVAIFLFGFSSGWQVAGWKTDAGQAHSIARTEKTAQNATVKVDKVQENKIHNLDQTADVYKTIKGKVNEINDNRICFADAAALQLYNNAVTGTDPSRSKPTAEINTTKTAETTEAESGFEGATTKDILNNAADNYETCKKNSINHDALVDVLNIYKDKMCVCAE